MRELSHPILAYWIIVFQTFSEGEQELKAQFIMLVMSSYSIVFVFNALQNYKYYPILPNFIFNLFHSSSPYKAIQFLSNI